MQRRPVSVGEYLAFLNDLHERGAEVAHLLPQRVDSTHLERPQVFALSEGRYFPVPDEDGVLWDISWPILRVNWHCAMAYARWWSERSGWSWRLPTEIEWEKAARGVDGRRFPWGDHFEAAWCRSKHSRPHGQHSLGPAGDPETDQSPYGLLGMAGNVSDWCLSASHRDPPEVDMQGLHRPIWPDGGTDLRNLRGGSYSFAAEWCRTDRRQSLAAQRARDTIGFRLICEQEAHAHHATEGSHDASPPR
jgi:serine/threonine-protein kinase